MLGYFLINHTTITSGKRRLSVTHKRANCNLPVFHGIHIAHQSVKPNLWVALMTPGNQRFALT